MLSCSSFLRKNNMHKNGQGISNRNIKLSQKIKIIFCARSCSYIYCITNYLRGHHDIKCKKSKLYFYNGDLELIIKLLIFML